MNGIQPYVHIYLITNINAKNDLKISAPIGTLELLLPAHLGKKIQADQSTDILTCQRKDIRVHREVTLQIRYVR